MKIFSEKGSLFSPVDSLAQDVPFVKIENCFKLCVFVIYLELKWDKIILWQGLLRVTSNRSNLNHCSCWYADLFLTMPCEKHFAWCLGTGQLITKRSPVIGVNSPIFKQYNRISAQIAAKTIKCIWCPYNLINSFKILLNHTQGFCLAQFCPTHISNSD